MYTAFMLALTLTTVANVLVTMAHRARCSRRWRARSCWATAGGAHLGGHRRWPGIGIAWMYGREVTGGGRHLLGTAGGTGVPMAACDQLDAAAAPASAAGWRAADPGRNAATCCPPC
jgi:hypothetical protein